LIERVKRRIAGVSGRSTGPQQDAIPGAAISRRGMGFQDWQTLVEAGVRFAHATRRGA
jgi:hypothetical protein